ncbi:MAG: hypothetical protein SVK08_06730 [Halobacteriota archaeon]|nr:hypothetical protein [Halobacteriota archaeon]
MKSEEWGSEVMNTELGLMELKMEEFEEVLQSIKETSSSQKRGKESVLQKQIREREELLIKVRNRRHPAQSISSN